jgi:hypothetical protein
MSANFRLSATADGFDEFALGGWLHVERLGDRAYFVTVGPRSLWVTVHASGRVEIVHEETQAEPIPKRRKEPRT